MTNYILEYYQAIKDGSIAVGEWIEKWYEYIIDGLHNKQFTFEIKKAEKAIRFVETFCRHHEGALAPKRLKLELWQKSLLSVIFGCMDSNGNRQFREVLVVVARKNGKTLLAAAISAYCAYLDGEYGGRIYFAAPKLQQANLCYDALYQMIIKEPELNSAAKKRRTDIYLSASNTSIAPLAFSAKKSDGLNISLCVADEIASWQGDGGLKFYEVIKSSFGARKQPLLLSISTAGYINDGVYDELYKRATRLLKGDSSETRFAPFIYQVDDITKWNDINELKKSNPNLGVSVTVDYMLDEIAIAEGSFSKKAEFLTKYCNIKQNSSTAWLSTKVINSASGEQMKLENFKDTYCVGGIDLSQTTDLTCCCVVIERDEKLHVFSQFFLPGEKLEEATTRDQIPYAAYVERGLLTLSGDNFVDYKDVYRWFTRLIEEYRIYPLQIGYDRYSAQYLVQDLKAYGFQMDDVFQGFNLSPVIKEFEGLMKDRKICIGDNDLLKIHLFNSALKYEAGTERVRLIKIADKDHIDGTAALLDAMTVRQKHYQQIGEQLKNL